MAERERQVLGHVVVDRMTRHALPARARTDGLWAVRARSADVCL